MKTRRLNPLQLATGALSTLLLLVTAGCGSTKVQTETNTHASVGQQLIDLQKAHDQGLVSDNDYERLRKAIIEKNQ